MIVSVLTDRLFDMPVLSMCCLLYRIVSKGSYSEKEASEVIASITSAISYLHGIGIVHRGKTRITCVAVLHAVNPYFVAYIFVLAGYNFRCLSYALSLCRFKT